MNRPPKHKEIYYSLTACFKDAVAACLDGVRREDCPAAEEWRRPWLAAWDETYEFIRSTDRAGINKPPSTAAENAHVDVRRWRSINDLAVIDGKKNPAERPENAQPGC